MSVYVVIDVDTGMPFRGFETPDLALALLNSTSDPGKARIWKIIPGKSPERLYVRPTHYNIYRNGHRYRNDTKPSDFEFEDGAQYKFVPTKYEFTQGADL